MAEPVEQDWRKVLAAAVRRDPRGQTGVARRMGVTQQYVSLVMGRHIDPPSPKFVARVLALTKPPAPEPPLPEPPAMAEPVERDWREVLAAAVRRDPSGQTGVAKRMGVSRPYVSLVMSRCVDPPSPKFIERVLALPALKRQAPMQRLSSKTSVRRALEKAVAAEPLGVERVARRLGVSSSYVQAVCAGWIAAKAPSPAFSDALQALLKEQQAQKAAPVDQPLLTGCTSWRGALEQAVQAHAQGVAGVAELMGVSVSYASKVLSGVLRQPSARFIERAEKWLMPVACPHLGEPITPRACWMYASRTFKEVAGSPGPKAHWRACIYCPHRPVPAERLTETSADPAEPASPAERAVFEAREAARQKAQPLRLNRTPVRRRRTSKEHQARMLAWLRKHGERSNSELARELAMSKGSADVALKALCDAGLVERLEPMRVPGSSAPLRVPYRAVAGAAKQGRPEAALDDEQGEV